MDCYWCQVHKKALLAVVPIVKKVLGGEQMKIQKRRVYIV